MNEFSKWLDGSIFNNNKTVYQVARDLGLSTPTIYLHLSGKVNPSRTTLHMYADYFDVDYWMLYEMIHGDS